MRAAQKKLRKELCREVRMKAKARSKALKAGRGVVQLFFFGSNCRVGSVLEQSVLCTM